MYEKVLGISKKVGYMQKMLENIFKNWKYPNKVRCIKKLWIYPKKLRHIKTTFFFFFFVDTKRSNIVKVQNIST